MTPTPKGAVAAPMFQSVVAERCWFVFERLNETETQSKQHVSQTMPVLWSEEWFKWLFKRTPLVMTIRC